MTRRLCRVMREAVPAPGSRQVAADLAMLSACADQETAWLRLHRYLPTASLGRHEAVCHAVREDFCRQSGISVVRRLTGGDTLYLDPGQCCLSLALPRSWLDGDDGLTRLMDRCNGAVARALEQLGIVAVHRRPNDLEAGGQKLGSGFVCVTPDAVMYQAVLLVEAVDMETLLTVLRAPREKLSPQGVQSARERFVALRDLLEVFPGTEVLEAALTAGLLEEFGLQPVHVDTPQAVTEAGLLPIESMPAAASACGLDEASGLDEDWETVRARSWQAFRVTAGGVLYLRLDPDSTGQRIDRAVLAGAVHVSPLTLLADLAAELIGEWIDTFRGAAETRWQRVLHDSGAEMLGFGMQDLSRLLQQVFDRVAQQALGLDTGQANALMVHAVDDVETTREILERATVMLVPYCAKPAWCKWRHRDGCPECGLCEVGDAYRMARERGMRVVTITRYEHLCSVFDEMRRDGESGYVGMCCSNFYQKRAHAFQEASIPAVLMDISGANCYDLRQEDQAYAGQFTAEARLDGEVLEKVMRWVPLRR